MVSLPNELLSLILGQLDYAYEVFAVSQTCRDLYELATDHLMKRFAKECSPYGLDRLVRNNNVQVLSRILDNGLRFDKYERACPYPTPPLLTVDDDLTEMAKLLLGYTVDFLLDDRHEGFKSRYRGHHRLVVETLDQAVQKESMGVLKAVLSDTFLKPPLLEPLRTAASKGKLDFVRCLMEEGAADDLPGFWYRADVVPELLRDATWNGDLEMVKYFVNAGVDLNDPRVQKIKYMTHTPDAVKTHIAIEEYLTEMGMKLDMTLDDFEQAGGYGAKRRIPNLAKKVNLEKIMADLGHRPYSRRCFFEAVAASNDMSLYQKAWEMLDSLLDWASLKSSFEIILYNGT